MTILDIVNDKCCGCTACESVCSNKAISMKENSQGFKYPVIDNDICTSCGVCYKVCPIANNEIKESENKCYAVRNTDESILAKSSSGGVSNALCKSIIAKNGVVYGVAYDEKYRVIVKRATTIEDCDAFFGSKYVQADLSKCFENIRTDLLSGKEVLFFGTSCYVAGLQNYLSLKKCNVSNLYTVDLICHGVPSPKLFADYISFLKEDQDFIQYQFRTKERAWGNFYGYGSTITYKNRKEVGTLKANLFLYLFGSNTCLRESCFSCPYTSANKPADITIADYWGIKDVHPDLYSEKGVSAVILRTNNGYNLLMDSGELSIFQTTLSNVCKKQPNLASPTKKSIDYNNFWKLYEEKGFLAIAKKYGNYSAYCRLKEKINKFIRRS